MSNAVFRDRRLPVGVLAQALGHGHAAGVVVAGHDHPGGLGEDVPRRHLELLERLRREHAAQVLDQLADRKPQIGRQQRLAQLRGRLENANYVKHAPKEVVNETKAQLAETEATLVRLQAEQRRFTELG